MLANENENLSRVGARQPARRARRRHSLPAHPAEHPRPVAHQAGRAPECSAQDVNFRRGRRRGDLQRPGHARRTRRRAIEKRFSEPNLPKVRTDLAKINQILFLLLDNAAKFTNRGHASDRSRDRRNPARARNDGHRNRDLRRTTSSTIFDEFFRWTARRTPSTAAPAWASRWCATPRRAASGETLRVESEIGHGTRFSVTLPVSVL